MVIGPPLPQSILIDLKGDRTSSLPSGGSTAANYLIHCREHVLFAKVVTKAFESTSVDGHRASDLQKKWLQMLLIEGSAASVSSAYAKPIAFFDLPEACALVTEFCSGSPLIDILDSPSGVAGLKNVLDHLANPAVSDWREADNGDFFERYHRQRIVRRLSFIRAHPLGSLLASIQNYEGWQVPSVEYALQALEEPGLKQRIVAPVLHFPFHGDLNLQNVLVCGRSVKFIDVRGISVPWDIVYDLGKIVFDVLLFNSVARSHIPIPVNMRLSLYWKVATILRQSDLGSWLDQYDAEWQQRLQATVILHTLSEAAARLSVADTLPPQTRHLQTKAAIDLWCRGLRGLFALRTDGMSGLDALPACLGILTH